MSAGTEKIFDIDAINQLIQSLAQYGYLALLVICLFVCIFALKREDKGFGYWLCWGLFGVCALLIIFQAGWQTVASRGLHGGVVRDIPKDMYLYADNSDFDGFFVQRRGTAYASDDYDYYWIILNVSSTNFPHVDFMISGQKVEVVRDPTTLKDTGTQATPAIFNFHVPIFADEEDDFQRRKLELKLHVPPSSQPSLEDRDSHVYVGSVEDQPLKTSFWFSHIFPYAHASSSFGDLYSNLESNSSVENAKGLADLEANFASSQGWIASTLADPKTTLIVQSAIIRSLHDHFYNIDLEYPKPEQLSFLNDVDYNRLVLDGLDTSTNLGHNSRAFLNNARDSRILDSFKLVRERVFNKSDAGHRSCLALFEISVLGNWAALSARDHLSQGQTLSKAEFDSIMELLSDADKLVPDLYGHDKVQAARIEYLRGALLGQMATDNSVALWQGVDRLTLLAASKEAFEQVLAEGKEDKDDYRYPYHFDVAEKFIIHPSPDIIENASGVAKAEAGCTDPADTSSGN